MSLLRFIAALLLLAATPVTAPAAERPNDAMALKGVTTGKVIWDISMANAETLAVYLSVVRETYDDLVRQNVTPQMVLAVHGAPVRYVTRSTDDLPLDIMAAVDKVNAILDDLAGRPGVRVEVCAVANRLFGIENATIRPNFHVVGNTWVSLIGYQAQGYALVPVN